MQISVKKQINITKFLIAYLISIVIINTILLTQASCENFKILLLNSDHSVYKYRIVQNSFIENCPYFISSIDLDKGNLYNINNINSIITDKSYDLIYCIGSYAYLLADKFANKKTILFSSAINWRRLPMDKTRFGISNEIYSNMQLMLFRMVFPEIKKIGILYSKIYNEQLFDVIKKKSCESNFKIIAKQINKTEHVIVNLNDLFPDIEALWLISDPIIISDTNQLKQIMKLCDKKKVPVLSYLDILAHYGAVLSISADDPTIGRQAAQMAANLLSKNPPKVKVQYPAGTQIILNLKKVKEYKLKYNQNSLSSINHIIE